MIFSKSTFSRKKKILLGISSECQTVRFQIRPYVMSGLIWFKTVCKGYQLTILAGKKLHAHADTIRFCTNLHLHPYFVYANQECSCESAHLRQCSTMRYCTKCYSLLRPFLCFTTNQIAQKFIFLVNLIKFLSVFVIFIR